MRADGRGRNGARFAVTTGISERLTFTGFVGQSPRRYFMDRKYKQRGITIVIAEDKKRERRRAAA